MHLREQFTSINVVLDADRVQTSVNPDKIGNLYAMVDELEREFAEEIGKQLMIKANISKLIQQLPDDRQRLILTERYINLKRWEQIALENNYSWNGVHRLHRKSLEGIEVYYLDMI